MKDGSARRLIVETVDRLVGHGELGMNRALEVIVACKKLTGSNTGFCAFEPHAYQCLEWQSKNSKLIARRLTKRSWSILKAATIEKLMQQVEA
ncbi:MAG: hypothetical protein HC936_16815 [Leptolyngbyaceae cyanobacterium SU_3_3]|nr:hypothetical protein [Leptolyngbyaceae cyanobacterium SU_3_3]